MRINVVTPWYPDYAHSYSGTFVHKQVEALKRAGHQVHVDVPQIFPAPSGPVPWMVVRSMQEAARAEPRSLFRVEDGTTYIPSPVPSGSGFLGRSESFAETIKLKREVMPHQADVSHAHVGVPTGRALARLGDAPLVVTEHFSQLSELLRHPQLAKAYAETMEAAAAFICVSPVLKQVIARALDRRLAASVEVVPNVVDLGDIPFVEPRPSFSNWIYVGGLYRHKGSHTLLKAFRAYLESADPEATLTVIGQGPERPWIESFVARHGVGERVRLLGQMPHEAIGSHLAGADVLVHLSPYETFGISALEAIGAGTPVVSFRNGGAEATWGEIEESCGLLLPTGASPDEIAERIASLSGDSERLDLRRGREFVEARYSAEVVASRLSEIYERVAA